VVRGKARGLRGPWELSLGAPSEGSSAVYQAFWAWTNVLASIIMSSKNTGPLTATKGMSG